MEVMSNAPTRRPRSISEVALRAIAGTDLFDHSVREFLDSFYLMHDAAEREAALRDEPPPVGERQDAYLAAVAEHLARRYHLEIPDWTEKPRSEEHTAELQSLMSISYAVFCL